MRCNHCQSLMFKAEVVKAGQTEQTLFECPTCNRTRLSSRRLGILESGALQDREQGVFMLKVAGVPG